jgi:ssDNA-binding Zn-finger/Zn-ribbon topoisomerase 1
MHSPLSLVFSYLFANADKYAIMMAICGGGFVMAKNSEGNGGQTKSGLFEGRYGYDSLGRTLLLLAFALGAFGFSTKNAQISDVCYIAALTLVFFEVMRMFSRNVQQRVREYELYDSFTRLFRYWFHRLVAFVRGDVVLDWEQYKMAGQRTVRYLDCPRCKYQIPVPPNRGKMTLKCKKCGKIMITKS